MNKHMKYIPNINYKISVASQTHLPHFPKPFKSLKLKLERET